ncbi:cupin domain-containing protein [Silvimonas amylolytica]|uniref:Cupin n=1 Tax=Silvimonas amylolytica TaxID=449663 RepID=A0ABQ2PQ53_9NEIS|nr:cupin domain-containing protein [Silvimonas amylolytica]GGP27466.1 cupin [Silvimonas amylolytica]
MNLNADITIPALEHNTPDAWLATPQAGVTRRPLFRIGDEIAQATSLVRYAPQSRFHAHEHQGGEEILVIEGTFSDEHGDFPAGTYFRNPPGTQHSPYTKEGCLLLVRLWQFDPADQQSVVLSLPVWPFVGSLGPTQKQDWPAHVSGTESVRLAFWPAGQRVVENVPGGGEWLVLQGDCVIGQNYLRAHSWYRLPCGAALDATAGEEGVWVWAKTGHLRDLPPPPVASVKTG